MGSRPGGLVSNNILFLSAALAFAGCVPSGITQKAPISSQVNTAIVDPIFAPSSLIATALSDSQIQLTWIDNSSNEIGFRVERASSVAFSDPVVVLTTLSNTSRTVITGLSADTTYAFRVTTVGPDGNQSAPSLIVSARTLPPPVVAPAAPSLFTATAVSSTQINLAWRDNASNETGFEVERASDSAFTISKVVLPVLTANSTTLSVTGLNASTSYYFRVRALNSAGPSTFSSSALATTQAPPVVAPNAPSNLTASAVSTSQINLSWADNSNNESGFIVSYSTSSSFASGVTTLPVTAQNMNSSMVTGLASSTLYYFRVLASNSAGSSPFSATVSATTQAQVTIPLAPSGLTASAATSSQINLTWIDNSNNETGFTLERSTSSTFTSPISTTLAANQNSLSVTGLSASTAYYFRVRASNSAGTSGNTASATATTLPVATPDGGWTLPMSAIPATSAFYPMLTGMDTATRESYRVLYHWLAHYTATDFDLPRTEITYDANFFASDENTFRFRSAASNVGRTLTDGGAKILQIPSSAFLLSNFDQAGKLVIQRDSNYVIADPIAGAWFYLWDYPGNPNYMLPKLMNRSFAYAIAAMVWLDNQHHLGKELRTDYAGGSLIRFAVPYSAGKALLPPVVQAAYEQILVKMFNRLNTWTLTKIFGDMEIQAAVGMYYTAKALGSQTYYTQAAARAQYIYEQMISGAGFEKHENGADLVYQGIAQYFMTWLLSATQADPQAEPLYGWLLPYIDRSCKYVNYLTYLDPVTGAKRNPLSPSHYHAANGGGLGSSIWNSGYKSFLTGGMYSNQCRTLLQNQIGDTYIQYPLTETPAQMRTTIQSILGAGNYLNMASTDCNGTSGQGRWSVRCASTDVPTAPAAENHWTNDTTFHFNYLYYKPGYYAELKADLAANAAWNKFPHQFSTNYIEQFSDFNEPLANKKGWFVTAKSSSLHTIWHIGGLAWRNSATNIAGFGGGAISSVGTTGPIIMGADRGNQDNPFLITDWRIWPTHHIAGQDSSGKYFGNARDRELSRTVTQNGNQSVQAIVTGNIGVTSNPLTNPSGNIKGNAAYRRELSFSQTTGISVLSRITSNGTDTVTELNEIIPVYLYNTNFNDCALRPSECTVISLKVGSSWVAPSTSYTLGVTAIRLTRLNTSIYVTFSTQQSVKLSPSEVTLAREPQHYRTLMIDLLGNNGSVVSLPASREITYTISTTAP